MNAVDHAAERALLEYFTQPERPPCRHCNRRRATRSRGLCWTCYYTPGVRTLYVSISPHCRCGSGQGCKGYRLPNAPTSAPPGSPQKVAVPEERVRLGVALWHPDDAPMDAESRRLGIA